MPGFSEVGPGRVKNELLQTVVAFTIKIDKFKADTDRKVGAFLFFHQIYPGNFCPAAGRLFGPWNEKLEFKLRPLSKNPFGRQKKATSPEIMGIIVPTQITIDAVFHQDIMVDPWCRPVGQRDILTSCA